MHADPESSLIERSSSEGAKLKEKAECHRKFSMNNSLTSLLLIRQWIIAQRTYSSELDYHWKCRCRISFSCLDGLAK